jgi:hypothetical protein
MDEKEVKNFLSEREIIKLNGKKIGLMHGSGNPNKLIELVAKAFENDRVDVIVFGHAHYAVNETRGGILYFNPGSPSDKIFAPYNSYGIIEINGDKIEGKIIKL